MPYVDIKIASKLSVEQKRQIAKDISTSLEKVANKPKATCYITFTEFDRDNFAKGEELLSDSDRKTKN